MDEAVAREKIHDLENGSAGSNKAQIEDVLPQSERKGKGGDPFNYDDIMDLYLGQMGKFQFTAFILLCLPALLPGPVLMSYTFTGAVPEYRLN